VTTLVIPATNVRDAEVPLPPRDSTEPPGPTNVWDPAPTAEPDALEFDDGWDNAVYYDGAGYYRSTLADFGDLTLPGGAVFESAAIRVIGFNITGTTGLPGIVVNAATGPALFVASPAAIGGTGDFGSDSWQQTDLVDESRFGNWLFPLDDVTVRIDAEVVFGVQAKFVITYLALLIEFSGLPQRVFPRDDGLSMSTRRSWPPRSSRQGGLRRGPSGTYL